MARTFYLGRELAVAERRKAAVLASGFAVFVLALLFFPHSPLEGTVLCPFRRMLGLSCPGCGMTRACIHLLHGRLSASLGSHPFGWVFVLGFLTVAGRGLVEALFGRRLHHPGRAYWKRIGNPVLMGCLAFIVIFGVVRLGLELGGFLTPV